MTQLSDIIRITISRETSAVAQAAFGIPGFISAHTAFSERARIYSSIDGVLADFATTSNTYKAAAALFGQPIQPEQIVIGRRQIDTVQGSVATVANTTVYTLTLNGTAITYTSDSSATAIEIATGLKTAFTAAAVAGFTMTDNLDGTFSIGVSTPGTAWSLKGTANLTLANVAATETWADTITAVRSANDLWYLLTAETHADADIEAIAAYIETQKKEYFASSSAVAIKGSGTTDVASVIKGLGYDRSSVFFSSYADTQYPECALVGAMATEVPGSADWDYKKLTGVTPEVFTDTESLNMANKNVTNYQTLGGISCTVGGNVASGEKIDIMIGVDWMEARMRENIWSRLINSKKIPYTNPGTTIIETEIRKVLADGIANNFLAASPAPVVNMPSVASQTTSDRANRIYRGITFTATLAGAIRKVSIAGSVSV